MTSDYAIETRKLTRDHGRKRALDALDLTLPRGGIHAIVGANGAGKSTLFRQLLGFQLPTSGECYVLGRRTDRLSPADRGRIGFVNEEHTLPGWARVDTVLKVQRSHYADRWDAAAFDSVIASFDLSDSQRIGQLSRGERSGLNLALALGQSPELLILDEPTLGLDVVARRRLLDALIAATGDERRTILYCSHQIDEVERLADTLLILERGRVASFSAPDEFCERLRHWVADVPFAAPPAGGIPGVLRHSRIDGIHHFTVIDRGDDFGADLRGFGAKSVQAMPVPLDRAVDAFLTRNHAGPAH
ncbi:ABC transporter ATP-binding protein [Sphingomonas floccifaciens]|uniref:ABC transporter ATP-binding protein n=1 Tax=Sphingomonas floccifaciens TaxID=1844115 RepID=A0ABW4N8B2_9SPHN